MDCSSATTLFLSKANELPIDLCDILSQGSGTAFISALSTLALDHRHAALVFSCFKPLSLEICSRWAQDHITFLLPAIGRCITWLPHITELASTLLSSAVPDQGILRALFAVDAVDQLLDPDVVEAPVLREILLALFRLLSFDNASFGHLVKPVQVQLFLHHKDGSIRNLAIRILCLYVHASDAVFQSMVVKYIGDVPCEGSWEDKSIDYTFLDLWEEKHTRDFRRQLEGAQNAVASNAAAITCSRLLEQHDMSPGICLANGVLLLRNTDPLHHSNQGEQVVLTSTTHQNLELIAAALSDTDPVLLTGLAGSGKTLLVKHLAAKLNKFSTMITLHLNEQSDAKLLVGVYTTGTQPGSFKWQPGVLTTAVREGRWVFIEDLDRAPNEVISVILPLIERRELVIPSRGETIKAAYGFKIIATIRTQLNLRGEESLSGTRLLGYRFWRRLCMQSLGTEELYQIIESRFPLLVRYIPGIMAVYQRLRQEYIEAPSSSRNHVFRTRPISTRELFKWCSRMSTLLYTAGSRDGTEAIQQHILDGIFLDAVDCLVGSLEESDVRDSVVSSIAEEMHVDAGRKQHLLRDRIIEVKQTSRVTSNDTLKVGRALLASLPSRRRAAPTKQSPFALTNHTQRLLEQISVAVSQREPLLLVGETGIGKTTAVQHLSARLGQSLLAINLSQQSETGDLLGGFKPVNVRSLIVPLKDEFDVIFEETFSSKKNAKFVETLNHSIAKGKWKATITVWKQAIKMAEKVLASRKGDENTPPQSDTEQRSKRRRLTKISAIDEKTTWTKFADQVRTVEVQVTRATDAFAFSFAEGKFVEAVRNGGWVLLDEINLAPADTLECISDLLEDGFGATPSILLTETGNAERVQAHPNFRLFAAMNPATDVGKRDLPMSIRSRFTEIYVNSPDKDIQSLRTIVETYLKSALRSHADQKLVITVADLYMEIQKLVDEAELVDGANQRPHYSLRTLSRALSHAVAVVAQCNLARALYEGFCMCFLTYLDLNSEARLQEIFKARLFGTVRNANAEVKKPLREPENGQIHVSVPLRIEAVGQGVNAKQKKEQHWLPKGQSAVEDPTQYIITPFVRRNLHNLIRATSTRKYPVLIQGPTSAGKTSMIEYLAKRSGNKFVRINNHEHTDLQEYLGTYVSTSEGKLIFQEGVLVQAVRAGHWVVLDELNLAPTDVLEALNRLLDDNRELLIPETQEIVRPHPDFMLFATQNPVGPYGGRKPLSRAFRNRFLELHFDDIPVSELNVILSRRSNIPESWCGLIVEVYTRLSQLRQENRLFEQNSFATLRDLFRWALRGADKVEDLATNGYLLLAEKVRKTEERQAVKEVIEQVMSRKGVRVRIDDEQLYTVANYPEMSLYSESSQTGVVWTKAMRRLYCLVSHALRNNEAVLLVGETGCGKTSVCQMLAQAMAKTLHIVNAHQNTETGDLIGAQRPVRNRGAIAEQLRSDVLDALHALDVDLSQLERDDIDALLKRLDKIANSSLATLPSGLLQRLEVNRKRHKALFEWCDGSLVQAMREGQSYLLDEISLADDSVLERLNSLLDPQRSILLAEKGTVDSLVTAHSNFQFFATMNPGGDFGKKELSPALRNRFTEIWVPHLSDSDDVVQIIQAKIKPAARAMVDTMVSFAKWFSQQFRSSAASISIRDILAWVEFMNCSSLELIASLVHGAALVYIDTLGANPSALIAVTEDNLAQGRAACLERLSMLTGQDISTVYAVPLDVVFTPTEMRVGPFAICSAGDAAIMTAFNYDAPTTKLNTMRIIRALQLIKPILLEGSPGVGKTSIVTAVANSTGHPLVRINLSEQTDLMDLFGSDAPVTDADGQAGQFAWRDAPFLTAMKQGHWVLLDEMNLASQSVLEGLNACLDHRGEVYIAELDQTFMRHPEFRLFAAQNPHHQGGGRKGLPASFVNRFTVVFADVFQQDDLTLICQRVFPSVATELISRLVSFVSDLEQQVVAKHAFGTRGSPWEFNLRDTLRWLQLLSSTKGLLPGGTARDFLDVLFVQRFRTVADERAVERIFNSTFGSANATHTYYTSISASCAQVGLGFLPRSLTQASTTHAEFNLKHRLPLVESLMLCVQQSWPVILVGPSGAGKTVLLQSLASLVGAELEVFGLSTDIDATDLVGGYEQVDPSRHRQSFTRRLETFLRDGLALLMNSQSSANDQMTITKFLNLLEVTSGTSINLPQIIKLLQDITPDFASEDLLDLIEQCESIVSTPDVVQMAKFEWIDGMLVQALEQGRWLVLDNANLCSSSVLDRLNSLLEPNGVLTINENCSEDGVAKVVQPHLNFRIFMTMDPQYGEVSRAMRNRAVELFVPALSTSEMLVKTPFDSYLKNPTLQQYRSLLDLFDCEATEAQVMRFVESFSQRDVHLLGQFVNQLRAGLTSIEYERPLAASKAAFEGISHLLTNWLIPIQNFYALMQNKAGLPTDFCDVQSIHALSNQPLVALSEACTIHDATYLSRRYDVLLDMANFDKTICLARERSNSSEAMSRLQRSFAADRIANASKDSTSYVANFFKNIMVVMVESLNETDHEQQSAIKVLQVAQAFLWKFFALVSSQAFEEAVFQMHLSIFRDELSKLYVGNPSAQVLISIAKELNGFQAKGSLTTGFGMEFIWSVARPVTVSSYERLETVLQLRRFAHTFDKMVWRMKAPLSELAMLRRAVTEAVFLATNRSVPVEPLILDLQEAVESMAQRLVAEADSQKPVFFTIFEAIAQYSDWRTENSGDLLTQDQNIIAMLACRDSRPSSSSTSRPLSNLLEILGRYLGFAGPSNNSLVLQDSLPFTFLHQIANSGSISLRQVDLLLSELPVLNKSIATGTLSLCRNQIGPLRDALTSILRLVIQAHEEAIKSKSDHDEGTQYFHKVKAQYFESLMRYQSSVLGNDTAIATDFLRLGMGCLLLYIPDRSRDPALRPIIRQKIHREELQKLTARLEDLKFLEDHQTGRKINLRIVEVENDIDDLGLEPAAVEIARPPSSQLQILQVDFDSILRVVQRIAAYVSKGESATVLEPGLLDNVTRLITRLSSGYHAYADITGPAIGFLQCLLLGLILTARDHSSQEDNTKEVKFLLDSSPFLSLRPEVWSNAACVRPSAYPRGNLKFQLHALTVLVFRAQVEAPSDWPELARIGCFEALASLYEVWKFTLTEEQKKAAANSSLYTHRGSQDDEDDALESEFQTLFPVFDETEAEEEGETSEPAPRKTHTRNPQDIASEVASLHMQIFGVKAGESSLETIKIVMDGSTAQLRSLRNSQAANSKMTMHQLLPAIMLALDTTSTDFTATAPLSGKYNAYTDSNIGEVKKIIALVYQIQDFFRPIREIWPEHATLSDIIRCGDELLLFKPIDPIMKILTKAEKLHDYIAEWQTVTSKEYNASVVFDKLTDLLIGWRQLEPSTWAKLMSLETDRCEADARSWWFIAYESVIAIPLSMDISKEEMNSHATDLIATLSIFISNSTCGQYSIRLRLLSSLLQQLVLMEAENSTVGPIIVALTNFLDHYNRFTSPIQEALTAGQKPIEKSIKEVIQLASWRDRNISILKQSVRASHRKLFRCVRKYRDLLGKPVHSFLTCETSAPISISDYTGFSILDLNSLNVPSEALQLCRGDVESWEARPVRFKNASATVKVMQKKTQQPAQTLDAPSYVDDLLDSMMESITHLQKATPATLTEENASTVKHLLSRKRKLFAETLKELRSMGISSNLSATTLASQDTLPKIISGLSKLSASATLPAISEAKKFLHKALDLVDTVRNSVREHNDDLNQAEINKSVGYFEGLVSLNLKQRQRLGEWTSHLQPFESVMEKTFNLWSSETCRVVPRTSQITSRSKLSQTVATWLPHMIHFGVRILNVQAKLGHLDFGRIASELEIWASKFSEMHATLSKQPKLADGLVDAQLSAHSETLQSNLSTFQTTLEQWSQDTPDARVVLEHIAVWTVYAPLETSIETNGLQNSTVQHINEKLFQVLDLVLGSVQDVEKALNLLPESTESNAWLTQNDDAHHSLLSAYHVPKISRALEDVLNDLHKLGPHGDALHLASASIVLAFPILQQYLSSYSRAVGDYLTLHRATAKMGYKLAKVYCQVASQGFCQPKEQETGQKGGDDKLEAGTGLGEGEGAEDISKDIADDEDLSEIAQNPEDAKKEKDMEGEDDAIEIDDELEGGAADGMKEDGNEEDGEKGEEEDREREEGEEGEADGGAQEEGDENTEKDGIDEGVGEVDELEPSAVDEKLWDQAGDEEAKEKEGKESAGKTDENDQAAGGKEEEKRDSKDEGEDGDQDDASEMSEDADAAALPDNENIMDPQVKDTEGLDLPEELQLDGDKEDDEQDLGDFDEEMLDEETAHDMDEPEDDKMVDPEDDEATGDPDENQESEAIDKQDDEGHSPGPEDLDPQVEPSTYDGNPNADDMTNDPSGGDAANEADEQVEEAANKADARNAGPDQATEEENPQSESSAQRATGAESTSDQNRDKGSTEESAAAMPKTLESQDREAIRKLGNILEQWHRQHKPIQEPDEGRKDEKLDKQEDANMADADFEHLPDDDTNADTQALGPATQDQATALDESMALPSELPDDQAEPQTDAPETGKEAQTMAEDAEMDEINQAETGQVDVEDKAPKSAIGERQDERTQSTVVDQTVASDEEDVLDILDAHLSTINLSSSTDIDSASQTQWQTISTRTSALSALLTSHLRLILAPTLATKLRGDFRTGKRLNIKRIIPYIASSYKRDKIWMRRSIPSKRAYQVLLAIDDSKSMGENGSSTLAFDTLALVARALATLEVGEVGVVGFGDGTFVAHDLGAPWNDDAGVRCIQAFGFQQTRTNVQRLVAESIRLFREARIKASGGGGGGAADLWQLQLIISDGICEDHEGIRRLLLQAQEERIMVVFVIVDAAGTSSAAASARNAGRSQSILDLERVEFLQVGEGDAAEMKLERKKYLQSFPFKYYLIVKDVKELPGVLSTALRQWFAEVVERG